MCHGAVDSTDDCGPCWYACDVGASCWGGVSYPFWNSEYHSSVTSDGVCNPEWVVSYHDLFVSIVKSISLAGGQ